MSNAPQTLRDRLLAPLQPEERIFADREIAKPFPDPNDPSLWIFVVLVEATREAANSQLEAAVAQKNAPVQIEAKLRETIADTVKSEIAREFAKQTKDQRSILFAIYHKRTWHKLLMTRILSWGVIPLLLFAGFSYFVWSAPSMWAISSLLEIPGAYVSLESGKAWVNMPKDSVDIVENAGPPDRTILKIKLPPRDLLEARKLLEAINDERAKPSR